MIFVEYPYLWASLAMLASCVAAMVLFPHHRKAMLVSGLLCTPFALASAMFVPEYWQPLRIACYVVGPEDFIFSFSCGVWGWLAAAACVRSRIDLALEPKRVIRIYSFGSVIYVGLILLFRNIFDLRTMTSMLLTGFLLYSLLLPLRKDLWRFSLLGGLVYCVVYTVFISIVFMVWPDFTQQWNWQNLWGFSILGVPLEESAFAFVFGMGWPLAMGYAFKASFYPKPKLIIAQQDSIDAAF